MREAAEQTQRPANTLSHCNDVLAIAMNRPQTQRVELAVGERTDYSDRMNAGAKRQNITLIAKQDSTVAKDVEIERVNNTNQIAGTTNGGRGMQLAAHLDF